MKQVTLTKIERIDAVSKNTGKGYQRVYIWTVAGGDTKLSGFGDIHTDKWNVGDTVTIEIKQVGAFWNFTPVKKEEKQEVSEPVNDEPSEIELLRAEIREINHRLGMVEQVLRDKEKSGVEKVFEEMERKNPFQPPTI